MKLISCSNHLNQTARLIVLALSCTVVSGAHSQQAGQLECPTVIQEKSIRIVDTPSGWTQFVAAPLYLHGAAPMSGPPDQLGELAGFKQSRNKGSVVHTYQLDGKFPEGKWLACTYGESDQVKLARRLADETNSCIFTYRKGEFVGQVDVAIFCK